MECAAQVNHYLHQHATPALSIYQDGRCILCHAAAYQEILFDNACIPGRRAEGSYEGNAEDTQLHVVSALSSVDQYLRDTV